MNTWFPLTSGHSFQDAEFLIRVVLARLVAAYISDWCRAGTGQIFFAHPPSPISLPRNGGQVGLCNVLFEDCSAFTRVTACTLAKSLNDPLHQRLQPLCYLHDCSDCFRLEQNRRVGFAPTEKRRLCTAHAIRRPLAIRNSNEIGHSTPPLRRG